MVPLRLVVRVVERCRDRVAVGGGRLPVRDLREQAGKFLDARPPLGDARTRRVRQERRRVLDLGGGLALGLAGRDPAADDVRPAPPGVQLDVDEQLGRDRPFGHPQGDRGRDLAGGREVAVADRSAPGVSPEGEPVGRLGRHGRARGAGAGRAGRRAGTATAGSARRRRRRPPGPCWPARRTARTRRPSPLPASGCWPSRVCLAAT